MGIFKKDKSEIASNYAGSLSWVAGNLNEAAMGLASSKGDLRIVATILLNVHTTLATSLFNIPGAGELTYRSKVKCDATMLREYGGRIPYITKINVSKLHSKTMDKLEDMATSLTIMGANIENLYNEKLTADNIKDIIKNIQDRLGELPKSFKITDSQEKKSEKDSSDTSNQDQKHKPLLSYSNVARELNNISRSVKKISETLDSISNNIQIPKIEESTGIVTLTDLRPENVSKSKKNNIAIEYGKVLSYVIPNISNAATKLDTLNDEYAGMMVLLDVHTSLATALFQIPKSGFTTYSGKVTFKPAKYRHKNYKPATCLKIKAKSTLISKSLKKLKDLALLINILGENIGLMEWQEVQKNLEAISEKLKDKDKLNATENKHFSLLSHPTIIAYYKEIAKLLDGLGKKLANFDKFKDSSDTGVIELAEQFIAIGNCIRKENWEKAKEIVDKITNDNLLKIGLQKK